MKILIRNRKTIEFLSGLDELSANADMVQVLEVTLDVPLTSRESLWVTYKSVDGAFSATREHLIAHNYVDKIPEGVILQGGEWKVQLFIREYDSVTGVFVTKASSNIATFTVPESLQLSANGTPITNATVAALYQTAVETIEEAKELKELYAPVKELANTNKNDIGNLENDKVSKSGDTMTGPLEIRMKAGDGDARAKIRPGGDYPDERGFYLSYSESGFYRNIYYGFDKIRLNRNGSSKEYVFPGQSGTFALEETTVAKSQVGQPNGVAPLDDGAKIPSEYLPSYVDDVIEFSVFVYGADWLERTLEKPIGTLVFCSADAEDLDGGEESPYYQKFLLNTDGTQEGLQIIAPEKGKIYVNTYSGKIYRWSGSGLFEISDLLKLGETSNTAYPGDKGKANADAIEELQEFLNDVPELNSTATPLLISKKDETGARRATIVLGEEYTDKTTGKVSYEAGIQSELVDIKAYEIDENGNKTTKAGVSVKNDGKVRFKGELCDENGNPLNAQIYEDLSQLKEILDLAEITEVVETTSTYDTRETADGLTLVPNAPTTVKKVVGSTVACNNLFDISKIEVTPSSVRSWVSSVGENLIEITTGALEGTSFNGYTSTEKSLQTLCPSLRAGDTVYVDFDTTATNGDNVNAVYVSGLGVWGKGTAKTITEESLSNPLVFYCDITPNTATKITNFCITKEQNAPYQPYFTGLKSASFAGVESKNADGTETSTLAFPATETPLGKTIDFETKKITDYGVTIEFEGTAEDGISYYQYGANENRRNGIRLRLAKAENFAKGISTDGVVAESASQLGATAQIAIGYNNSTDLLWVGFIDDIGITAKGEAPADTNAVMQQVKAYLAQRYADGNPVTIRYLSSVLQSETPFTAAQEAAGNTYTPYTGGTETQLNENAKFGANNTVTQDYDIVNKIGG